MHSQREKQTKVEKSKSCSVEASWIEDCRCLADIEEGRLCGKRRRVAFIYELRIEPTKEGNVV